MRWAVARLEPAIWDARYDYFRQQYDLDPGFRFNGPHASLYGEGQIHGGANSYIGDGTTIQAVAGHRVSIGHDCAISHAVRIYTMNRDPDQPIDSDQHVAGDVTIGDYVWIGVGAFIGQGVTIGDHAVVGANSVVTRDVEPWTIVSGVPAQVVRRKRGAPPLGVGPAA
jgi:maltose O-acetyltransferase